ncbi:MAG TPA: cellulose binding domain-containing protein [Steroidobacteraceae bacterium]|jgi:hypothetical protein|nr:cellulose binding domain-containing protein [Steroidobacteraceae bacterium]
MKHSERRLFQKSSLLKPAACITLALSAISTTQIASAHWGASPGSDIVWCNGDGTDYAPIPGFPADTNPFGLANGKNPSDSWDPWIAYLDYLALVKKDPSKYSPLSNPPNLSNILETDVRKGGGPSMVNDVYAVQLNYWNSIANGTINAQAPFGHSAGHSCLTYADIGSANAFVFTITYPASASTVNANESKFHADHPNDFPQFVPFSTGFTAGGPTGYVSAYKGCSWDGNSCTMGSSIPKGKDANGKLTVPAKSTDMNVFPVQLSSLNRIPTTWTIDADTRYGNPFLKDKTQQAWDASWDIWFDKTAHTDEGQAPYGPVRGQNDGLEIMVWMNHNGSYVDATTDGTPHEDQAGLIQPAGHLSERVFIGGTMYDVWVGRLNNPYFGYETGEVLQPNQVQGECKGTLGQNGGGTTCGTEWNVVSFVATNTHDPRGNSDYRKNSASIDAKNFTDYIMGIQVPRGPNGSDWNIVATYRPNSRDSQKRLQCPASALHTEASATPAPCLDQSWYLMSIQAGFETWKGGNGLTSKNFTAYAQQPTSTTTPGVTVNLTVNGKDWQQGYCRNVIVTNTNNVPVTWTALFDLPYTNSKIYQTWTLTYQQIRNSVVASGTDPNWNVVLKAGQVLNVGGFCASM